MFVFLAVTATGVVWLLSVYNKLIRMIEAVNNNKSQIDIQLDRRFKVYESLIEVVKKYMDYEKTTLKEVIALRTQAQQAQQTGDEAARVKAEDTISKIGTSLNLVFEQYPDLKADKNVLQLQEEIVSTENKLTFAKQAYNDSIERYLATSKAFLESVIVSCFPDKLIKQFVYWEVSAADRSKLESYQVKL